jgi:ABC-type Fe3+/spermidine/putrescine transport system ATPase subunit
MVLFPDMTVQQSIAFWLRMQRLPRPENRSRVQNAREMVGRADRASHRPAQLSGAQKQRLALAPPLVRRPKVRLLN